MGYMDEEDEGLNVPKSRMSEFYSAVADQLGIITGLTAKESNGVYTYIDAETGLPEKMTLDEVRRPMLVIGKPGIGKTAGIQSIINSMNEKLPPDKHLAFKKIQLGQTVVGELNGLPEIETVQNPDGTTRKQVRTYPSDWVPTVERDGEYGVLFLDEITSADVMQVQPALGLCDTSRMIAGGYKLPEHWVVIGAGNGPDCTNFVRLDDMTLSRFVQVFDIAYDYELDFKQYAYDSGLNMDIIAYLNFKPQDCVRVESSYMDKAGKQFPCPRTWENLSVSIKTKKARGGKVSKEDMKRLAGNAIGTKTAESFFSFLKFKDNMQYDPQKILEGKEKMPKSGERLQDETYHLLLENLVTRLKGQLELTGGNRTPEFDKAAANFLEWFFNLNVEQVTNLINEIKVYLPELNGIMFDDTFVEANCPSVNQWFEEHSDFLANHLQDMRAFRL